jgi:FtsH-binding integral membrane protein
MYQDDKNTIVYSDKVESLGMARTFIANVFSWMFLALLLTAATSVYFASNENLLRMLVSTTGMTTLGYVVLFAPLGLVMLMSMGFQRISLPLLTLLFLAYAVLMGMSLSFIFLMYSLGSIFLTFGITAGMFGIMAIMGYTTQTDLTKFGSLLIMGVVGIIIASIVNMFMHSGTMDYIISFIGVLVFTGLTAYDVQKLKRIGSGVELGTASTRKLTLMGALTLYLDFINLFLFLLRFFGNRK